ncbi:MAG TPA: DUF2726 domain-containing protein [Candidatus Methylomirabilis sp.]
MKTGQVRRQGDGVWGVRFLLVATLVLGGVSEVEAAYRLVFQNGSTFEVPSYEDLGDAIRYQRHGGSVVVPKASLAAITAVPDPAPLPSVLTPRPAPVTPPAVVQYPEQGSRPPATFPGAAPSPAPASAPARPAPGHAPNSFSFISGAVSAIWYFIAALVGFAVIRVGIQFLFRQRGRTVTGGESLPYEKVGSLLTAAERSFYGALCQEMDSRYQIFAKVRLSDLVEVPRGTPRILWYRNMITQKHVDFVLCTATDLTPQLVIELDDSSHARRDRRKRDAFVDAALAAAGLPILRVPTQRAYAPAELRAMIEDEMQPSESLATHEVL